MEITEVRVTLRDEDKLKAFCSVTFDDVFVVRGLKVINGKDGYFVSMPSRKKPDGTYQDIAHPINNDMRRKLEERILDAYEMERNKQQGDKEKIKSADAGESEEAVAEVQEEEVGKS